MWQNDFHFIIIDLEYIFIIYIYIYTYFLDLYSSHGYRGIYDIKEKRTGL